jgi:hypothetical protein
VEGKEDRRGKAHETYDGAGLVLCARLRIRQVRRRLGAAVVAQPSTVSKRLRGSITMAKEVQICGFG